MGAIWRFLSSVRLAVVLILLITALGLVGTFVVQIPQQITGDAASINEWLGGIALPNFGIWTNFLYFIGVFNIFQSPIFLAPASLLVINIIVCSAKRWRSLQKISKGVTFKEASRMFNWGNGLITSGFLSPVSVTAILSNYFYRRGYRLRLQSSNQNTIIIVDKNRYSPWSTYLIHLSLIVLIAGYLLGVFWGFHEDSFIVSENTAREIGQGYEISLSLKSFEDRYWPDGTPKDYVSYVVLSKGQEVIKEGLIRINQPMDYDGLRIYQSFFGPAIRLLVSDNNGNELYHASVALSNTLKTEDISFPYGTFFLINNGVIGYIIGPAANTANKTISTGELGLELYKAADGKFIDWTKLKVGSVTELQGLRFTLEAAEQFSGFQLKSDPGLPLIWIGCALFMIGIIVILFFPHRQMLVMINPQRNSNRNAYVLFSVRKDSMSAELDEISKILGGHYKDKQKI